MRARSHRIRYVRDASGQLYLSVTMLGHLAVSGNVAIWRAQCGHCLAFVFFLGNRRDRGDYRRYRYWQVYFIIYYIFTLLEQFLLCSDFIGRCTSADILIQFYDAVVDIPAEDLYYLLQTFTSMALSRMDKPNDHSFVERVTLNLFEVIRLLFS